MIAVLDYGIGNLRSAEKALQHLGATATLVSDPDLAAEADAFVLPGVGAFGRCMEALRSSGLDRVVSAAVADDRPFLGICVGMQLLYDRSDEAPDVAGLGILPGRVRRLPAGVKHPQMQWNRLQAAPGTAMPDRCGGAAGMLDGLDGGTGEVWMYFLHSYAPPAGPEVVATCDYGGPVTAAVARGNLWATQFHPEKSGASGLALLANFIRMTTAGRAGLDPTPGDGAGTPGR